MRCQSSSTKIWMPPFLKHRDTVVGTLPVSGHYMQTPLLLTPSAPTQGHFVISPDFARLRNQDSGPSNSDPRSALQLHGQIGDREQSKYVLALFDVSLYSHPTVHFSWDKNVQLWPSSSDIRASWRGLSNKKLVRYILPELSMASLQVNGTHTLSK